MMPVKLKMNGMCVFWYPARSSTWFEVVVQSIKSTKLAVCWDNTSIPGMPDQSGAIARIDPVLGNWRMALVLTIAKPSCHITVTSGLVSREARALLIPP